jgi:Ran GTPase-activating protein (RanGAP) involved in mRNA processing and transport
LIELALKQQTKLDLNKGPAHVAFIEILRANHKTLRVLDLSGNLITDSCIEAISNLVGIEITGSHISKLGLHELVLMHLVQFDKQLDLLKIIPKLSKVAPFKEPLVIKLSHY